MTEESIQAAVRSSWKPPVSAHSIADKQVVIVRAAVDRAPGHPMQECSDLPAVRFIGIAVLGSGLRQLESRLRLENGRDWARLGDGWGRERRLHR